MESFLSLQASAEVWELPQVLEEALVFVRLVLLQALEEERESVLLVSHPKSPLLALEEQACESVSPYQASEQPCARVPKQAWEE